jgi:glycosyltransferase involved in cell wall biosynthesis
LEPGVSVIIPTYNRAPLLGDAITSVLGQDFEPMEVVIVDDGSTDETQGAIAESTRKSRCPVRVITQANAGPSAARNAGILGATYDYVAFLDSDNTWRPGKLDAQMPLHLQDGRRFSFTAYAEVGPSAATKIVRVEDWPSDALGAVRRLLIGCVVNTSTVIAHRDVLLDVGLFDAALPCCEDHDLWLKIAARGHRFDYLDDPLTDYRVHHGSVSQQSGLVARSTERVFENFFREIDLPSEIAAEASRYLSRCYLNSACRYVEAKDSGAARKALWRAAAQRPSAVRPGWLRIAVQSAVIDLVDRRRGSSGS